jgi:16S rRNA G1207 methylase RsmC
LSTYLEPIETSQPTQDDESQLTRRVFPRVEEKCLIAELQSWDWDDLSQSIKDNGRVLSVSSGRYQASEWLGREHPNLTVKCWHIDSFLANRTNEQFRVDSENLPVSSPSNVEVVCQADAPEEEVGIALLTLVSTGEAELSRDYLQQLYGRLLLGGRLVVAVDREEDRWVFDQLKLYEKSVKVRDHTGGKVYWIEKTSELKKWKDFSCQLAFRDCDELIQLVTRPGVFSHRQLDNGARQLLDAVDVFPEARLLDIGCGAGSVALGLAKRDESARVHAVDANARAIHCVQRGIELNRLSNLTTEVNPTGIYGEPESYDMALTNPPYYGDFRIAEKFIQAGFRSLRSGGRLVIVMKQPRWYEEYLPKWFNDCEVFPSRRYFIASGIKPS